MSMSSLSLKATQSDMTAVSDKTAYADIPDGC